MGSEVFAQRSTSQQKLDSLLLENERYVRDDSTKLSILRDIYRQYMRLRDEKKALPFVEFSIKLAKKTGFKFFEAEAYYHYARFNHGRTNFQKAEELYLLAADRYEAVGNQRMVAGTYLNLGDLYNRIPDYAKALAVNQRATAIYLQIGEKVNLASCYTNIGEIYQSLNQHFNALGYLKKALMIFEKEKSFRGQVVVHNQIGKVYFSASKSELLKMGVSSDQRNGLALSHLERALEVENDNDESVLGPLYQDLGNVYVAQGKRELAFYAYEKAISFNEINENKAYYASSLLAMSDFYEQDHAYQTAEDLLLAALKIGEQKKLLEIQRNAYQKLSSISEKQGDFNEALTYYQRYIYFKDQIFNEDKEREIIRRQMQLDFSVKEGDYKLKQQLTDGELQRQILLAKQQQQQLLLQRQRLEISNQEGILQKMIFLKRQADLESQRHLQATLFSKEQIKAKLDKELRDKEIDMQKADLRFNRNVNIFLGIVVALLFAIAIFVYFSLRKTARLNQIVSDQKERLERLSHVKDRIFSVVSHDMRSPINSLISFTQLLENGDISTSQLKRYAANLKHALGYTSSMMENLLNWASSQLQGFSPLLEKFDSQLCAQEVLNTMQFLASQKHITLENKIKSGLLCFADLNMTSLVLRNLLSNAIKFTPEQGYIYVDARIEGNQLLFLVVDNGLGIGQDGVDEINAREHQGKGRTTYGTNNEKGTGIGLILCKTFTELMNGQLTVESKLGFGSTFTLSLSSGMA